MHLKIPAGKHLMDLVSVGWFKDSKRMDHVARCHGCAAQVSIFGPSCLSYSIFVAISLSCCVFFLFLLDNTFV